MFERFTDRARRVVVLAQDEARMLNHDHVGTEHLLLGLILEGEGVAARALESLGISQQAVRRQRTRAADRQPLQVTRERDQQPVQGRMARLRPRLDPHHQDMPAGREVHHGDGPPR